MPQFNARNFLRKLGEKGLVICESESGSPSEKKYFYVLDEEWMARRIKDPSAALKMLLEQGVAVSDNGETNTFVNLDKLGVTAPTDQELSEARAVRIVEDEERALVLHLHNSYYGIPSKLWKGNVLPEGAAGDAGAVADRGALVANIPDDDIPIGTYCVFVNIGMLTNSRKA